MTIMRNLFNTLLSLTLSDKDSRSLDWTRADWLAEGPATFQ